MSTPHKQLTTPRMNNSAEYQDLIQNKIQTIKSAIDKIKQSDKKSARESNSCEQTPRADISSNIQKKQDVRRDN